MSNIVLHTERLRLELQTPADVLAWIESLDDATKAEVSPAYIDRLRAADGPDPWTCGFIIFDPLKNLIVGRCGFKARPDSDDAVEIAYGVEPGFQGQGYATEAAQGLVAFCRTRSDVKLVRAHTLIDNGASARVLQKAGFHYVGEVVDLEDGLVQRWEIVLN